jgi:hypothetical protein
MNVRELYRLRKSDNEECDEYIKKESGLPKDTEHDLLCMRIGYHAAFNQIQTEMIRLDEEMGETMNPEKESENGG